jgi:hypothetical protein
MAAGRALPARSTRQTFSPGGNFGFGIDYDFVHPSTVKTPATKNMHCLLLRDAAPARLILAIALLSAGQDAGVSPAQACNHFGGVSPGDISQLLIWAAVSVWRAFRKSISRFLPAGRLFACSLRRCASAADAHQRMPDV